MKVKNKLNNMYYSRKLLSITHSWPKSFLKRTKGIGVDDFIVERYFKFRSLEKDRQFLNVTLMIGKTEGI